MIRVFLMTDHLEARAPYQRPYELYPVPPVESLEVERQNALDVSPGMNVPNFPEGKRPKATARP